VGKFNIEAHALGGFGGPPQRLARAVPDKGKAAGQHLPVAQALKQLIQSCRPCPAQSESRLGRAPQPAGKAVKTLASRSDALMLPAQVNAFCSRKPPNGQSEPL